MGMGDRVRLPIRRRHRHSVEGLSMGALVSARNAQTAVKIASKASASAEALKLPLTTW